MYTKNQALIDLRSDTVTLPTREMLDAIKTAKLGDDVYGEDPTVKELEELAARKLGKEAALLVPSGTQANLISLMTNCKRGDLVILESQSHIYWYEVGGLSAIGGLFPWLIETEKGAFGSEQLENAIRPKNIHFPEAAMICVENTHNRHGGTIVAPTHLEVINQVAKKYSLKLYMDGARIFNAAIALGVDVQAFTRYVDCLMFSLSKGLCCPVGSVIVGGAEFIESARKVRKMLGGGMRQAGIIAAPGIIALEKMINRLKEDHNNAKNLARGLSTLKGILIDPSFVQTNIVTFDLDPTIVDDKEFISKLAKNGVLAALQAKNKVRMVTHYGISKGSIDSTIATVREILS
jgi:threonine aldolase